MKESLMRAHTKWQQWVVPAEGSLVTLLCRLIGTKDTPTFYLPMSARKITLPPLYFHLGWRGTASWTLL